MEKIQKLDLEYQNKLLITLKNSQLHKVQIINPNLYKDTLNEIIILIKTNKLEDYFIINLLGFVKLEDLEYLYKTGVIDLEKKKYVYETIIILFKNKLKLLNHKSFLKLLFISLIPNLDNNTIINYSKNKTYSIILADLKKFIEIYEINFDKIDILEVGNVDFDFNFIKLKKYILSKVNKIEGNKSTLIEIKKGIPESKSKNTKILEKKIVKQVKETKKKVKKSVKKAINKSEILDIEVTLLNTNIDFSKDFFQLLKKHKDSRRTNYSIQFLDIYKKFIKESDLDNFLKLIEIEKFAINRGTISQEILEYFFYKMISFNRFQIAKQNKIAGYKLRLESIAQKLIEHFGDRGYKDELENYLKTFSSKEIHKDLYLKKLQEEELKKRNFIYFSDNKIDDLLPVQKDIFFSLLGEYKLGNRTDPKILPINLYISFIKTCSEDDIYKILEIEKMTINSNNLEIDVLKHLFIRLFTLDRGTKRGAYLKKRINSIKSKILILTGKKELEKELENLYKKF